MKVKVKNMTSQRYGREVANQFIIEVGENLIVFQSYDSVICQKLLGGRIMLDERYWKYSKTTSKYLHQFLNMSNAEIMESIKDGRITLTNLN